MRVVNDSKEDLLYVEMSAFVSCLHGEGPECSFYLGQPSH